MHVYVRELYENVCESCLCVCLTHTVTLSVSLTNIHTYTHTSSDSHPGQISQTFYPVQTLRPFTDPAFVDNATMNMGIHIYVYLFFAPVIGTFISIPGSGIAGSYVVLFPILKEASVLFFSVISIYIPTNSA